MLSFCEYSTYFFSKSLEFIGIRSSTNICLLITPKTFQVVFHQGGWWQWNSHRGLQKRKRKNNFLLSWWKKRRSSRNECQEKEPWVFNVPQLSQWKGMREGTKKDFLPLLIKAFSDFFSYWRERWKREKIRFNRNHDWCTW